ncbi:unnamed protein product [Cercopithifilaria johnstoni]|uniref:Uncharacterized protein n=1 Tax=Cercopithifilaria johnstoni TaxID=2874296 RepID=A0A8J2MRN0_9BILA|nr:unnamed protein product [Cercopithifilaria johnstoni]
MLNGWLTSLQCCVVILAIVNLSGLFRHTKATLSLAKEDQDQAGYRYGRYCTWNNYDPSILNFKERDIPIALVFAIDHNLTPIKLKQVLDTYHAVACLLPNDSNYLYAVVLHLPKYPKLYFGKLLNTDKLHQSFEDAGQATKGHKQQRWLINKIILNATNLIHSKYQLERKNNIAEQLNDSKNRSIFDGTRLLLSNLINQSQNEFVNKKIIKKSLIEFLREILFESIIADAIFSTDLTDNWIKYDFVDFKKRSQPSVIAFEGWTWLLNLLRVVFFLVGAFVVIITTCALCGFTCVLSSIVRDDYYRRRQAREREQELRILQERLHDVGINVHLNPFNDQPELEREINNEINTAIEQLSVISEPDFTQSSTTSSDSEGIPSIVSSSWPQEQVI